MKSESGEGQWFGRTWRLFPVVVLVTGAVCVLPIVAVWGLRSSDAVTSLWLLLLIAIGISQGSAWLMRGYWTRSSHKNDLLFSELLIWGWLWHLRSEQRLRHSATMLRGLQQEGRGPGSLSRGRQRTQATRWRAVRQLATALDAQDVYLHGHSHRVARHSEMIGRRMRLSSAELARLRAAAAAHDVGKLAVPRALLDKPGALTESEFASVKRHADEGAKLVALLGDPEITAIVRHHHERIDGRGYPSGLVGEQIPLGARIVAVADTFDAITSERPYRPAAQHREAIATLKACAGTQLDPRAVEAFLASYSGWRGAFLLAPLLAGLGTMLARVSGGRPSSFGSSAANAAAIVGVAAAVAVAAGTTAAPQPFLVSSRLAASVPGLGGAVDAIHITRSHRPAVPPKPSGASSGAGSRAAHTPSQARTRHASSKPGGGGAGSGGTARGQGPQGRRGGSGGGHSGGGARGGTGGHAAPTRLSRGTTSCNGSYFGRGADVVIPAGATCTLNDAQVLGDVVVDPGGTLIGLDTAIGNNLIANGAASLRICGTTIDHDLRIGGASGSVTIGASGTCAGNTIGHNLIVRTSSLTVSNNNVGHNMRIRGSGEVSGNTVGHNSRCLGVSTSSNSAEHHDGC